MPAISVKSPGKTILFGEHAVVYGHPAIAVPLNSVHLRVSLHARPNQQPGTFTIINHTTGEKTILSALAEHNPIRAAIQFTADHLHIQQLPATEMVLSSTIPIASGLGSSAALAVSIIRGLSQYLGFNLSNDQINTLAFEIEKIQHGQPSGIDNSVITYNHPIYYIKGQPPEYLKFEKTITLIVANTGIPSLTKETVSEVRAKLEEEPEKIKALLDQIGKIGKAAKAYLVSGQMQAIGQSMIRNHELLCDLGVSCPELDRLVSTALDNGAYGAKLCGSGKGGNMVAIAAASQAGKIKQSLLDHGAVSALIAQVQ